MLICKFVLMEDKIKIVLKYLDEKQQRIYLASEALSMGYGGITKVSKVSGVSRVTITNGIRELKEDNFLPLGMTGKKGGGRKKEIDKNPELVTELLKLIDSSTRGEPDSPLLWTTKSLRSLSFELKEKGYNASRELVSRLLKSQGYSLQSNRKTNEGKSHPDRDAQFQHISNQVLSFQEEMQPVISIDSKKKELIGNFKNNGQEWRPKGKPVGVNVYDFPSLSNGRATPYGVYDITQNKGWVNVGINHDTAEFAVHSIRLWWLKMGRDIYKDAKKLLIVADGGGSNGFRIRLWKKELQGLSNELGIDICICHFPPGTSKWNKIEHRLFSFITKNWRGRPLTSYEVIVNLIASTKTKAGLAVKCQLDEREYVKGIKVSDEEYAKINIERENFHGEWNYKISPSITS